MENTVGTKKTQYVLGFLVLLFFLLAASAYFVNTRYLFSVADGGAVNDFAFYIWSIGLLLFSVAMYIFAKRHFYLTKCWPYAVALAIFMLASLLGTFLPSSFANEAGEVYSLSLSDKMRSAVHTVLTYVIIYDFIAICPFLSRGKRIYKVLYLAVSAVALAAIVYSYVTEFDIYKTMFSGDSELIKQSPIVQSFTSNRNIYGFLLFAGLASESFLIGNGRRFYHWFFFYFYYANLIFPCSKTCMVISVFFALAFLIYNLVIRVRKHVVKAILPLAIFLIVHGLICLFAFVDFGPSFGIVHNFFVRIFEDAKEGGTTTFAMRFEQIKNAYDVISSSPASLWFGFGDVTGMNAYFYRFGEVNRYMAVDSSIAVCLLQGGIFGGAFFLLGYGYIFAIVILTLVKRKNKSSFLYLFLFVACLARSFMEVAYPGCLNWSGLALYGMIAIPALSEIRYRKTLARHMELSLVDVQREEEKIEKRKKKRKKPCEKPMDIGKVFAFTMPFFVSFMAAFHQLSAIYGNSFFSDYWNFGAAITLYLTVTLGLYFCFFYLKNKNVFSGLVFFVYAAVDLVISIVGMACMPGLGAFFFSVGGLVLLLVLSLSLRAFRTLEGQLLVSAYFLLWSAFFVLISELLMVYFSDAASLNSVFGTSGIVFAFSFFHSSLFEFWVFPTFQKFFSKADQVLLPFIDRKAAIRHIKKMR